MQAHRDQAPQSLRQRIFLAIWSVENREQGKGGAGGARIDESGYSTFVSKLKLESTLDKVWLLKDWF